MGLDFLRASLSGDRVAAEMLLGATLPSVWPDQPDILARRLAQLSADPALEEWLMRALVWEASGRVVGIGGFHGPPGGDWLRDYAPEGVEFGYTVFEEFRRQGIAYESSAALMKWARDEHGVTQFVLSMSPSNEASAGVAAKLGFQRVGEWQHEVRGLEHVYRRTVAGLEGN